MRLAAGLSVALLLLSGCAASRLVVPGDPVASPYAGPMQRDQNHADEATVLQRSGAAGLALECDGEPYAGGAGDYVDGGHEATQNTPAHALEDWLINNQSWAPVPDGGYRVERTVEGRVLFSYDVKRRTKVALIAADGLHDYNGDSGWGIESWAQCDPAELPAEVSDDRGIEVWEDADKHRVPVTVIRSFRGAKHCDWSDITFLELGEDRDPEQYLRDTHREVPELLRTTFDGHAVLPADATDTGFRRDDRQLWTVPAHDAAYLVEADDPGDVERWPGPIDGPIRCA